MENSIDKVSEFIARYPIDHTCSTEELNKFSKDLQRMIEEHGIPFSCEGKSTSIIYSGCLKNGSSTNVKGEYCYGISRKRINR